jgi:lysophospholipase L1-like esterase
MRRPTNRPNTSGPQRFGRLWAFLMLVLMVAGCGSSTPTLQVDEAPLVYLAMGDSIPFEPSGGGESFFARYRTMLEEDFGVDVDAREHKVGGQRTDEFLEQLRSNDQLREDLAAADVVTLRIPDHEWIEPMMTAVGANGLDPSDCGGEDEQQCLRDAIDTYKRDVDQIFEELTAIVDPSHTVVRVQDTYQLGTNQQTAAMFDIIYPYWREAQEYIQQVADGYGIPVAHVFDDFMGTDGAYVDLVAKGLVDPDGSHPTAEGALRIATLMHDLGYDLSN